VVGVGEGVIPALEFLISAMDFRGVEMFRRIHKGRVLIHVHYRLIEMVIG